MLYKKNDVVFINQNAIYINPDFGTEAKVVNIYTDRLEYEIEFKKTKSKVVVYEYQLIPPTLNEVMSLIKKI